MDAFLFIKIKDDVDWNESWLHDVEESIVHELIHIVFAHTNSHIYESFEKTVHEQAIDRIARVLVYLKCQATDEKEGDEVNDAEQSRRGEAPAKKRGH